MQRTIDSLYALNRGVVAKSGLARMDVKRLALAAEIQENWLPKVLGPMIIRPGTGYIGSIGDSERLMRFVFATDDFAILEATPNLLRVWINDALVTRPSVATTITNGTFDTNLTGWTNMDDAGGTSSWAAGGYMQLVGSGTARAMREQHVTNASSNTEHGIRINIRRGPVTLRIGSTSGDDDLVGETTLYTGYHSLAITPVGDFYIRFFSTQIPLVLVDSCTIEAAGIMTLPTPWPRTSLGLLRYDQSGDVVFVACKGIQQRRIERRGTRPNARSWSVVLYRSPDGPFLIQNTSATTIAVSAITGNIGMTSSLPLFKPTHVGALFSVTSVGQTVTEVASGVNQFSNSIRVVGLSAQRGIIINITGVFNATVVLQQSFDGATWADVAGESWTAPVVAGYNDKLDNQIVLYRIGIEGTYVSGTATCTLSIGSGSIRGIARITDYVSSTAVNAEVITAFGGTAASATWEEGKWSDLRGWPSAVTIHEGRMWWGGLNGVEGSISDAYDSFDETQTGDAGPIDRTIGSGPVDTVNWLLSLKGLILGAQGAEYTVRSSSLDEPLTPTNFNLKTSTTHGSGATPAVKIDQGGYFVDRTGCKIFEFVFDIRAYDYTANDLMALNPELGVPGIVRVDVQRKPDTRIHAVRSDGTVLIGVIDRTEEVMAWVPVTTSGFVEDVAIFPAVFGDLDDQVYYVIRRIINGATVRYLEKWAQETDTRGDSVCLLADSYLTFNTPASVFNVPHLIGQSVVVWADGLDVGTDDSQTTWTQRYSVASNGTVTLPTSYSDVVIGLPYGATFKSAKLGSTQGASPLNQQKKLSHIGLILNNTHRKGVRYGPSLDVLDDMPEIEDGAIVTEEVPDDLDQNLIEFPGTWTTDMRVCLVGAAPRPATVMSITFDATQDS